MSGKYLIFGATGSIGSNLALQLSEKNEDMHLISRNEPELNLVHPFHEDESITTYSFKWYINEESYGELLLCHSHVL